MQGRPFPKTSQTLSTTFSAKFLLVVYLPPNAVKYPENPTSLWSVISVFLAFMNLLPIPVLDGGYILFILWEMITGKKVGDKFMQRALTIGMYFVLALLIFSNGNDIVRALR